MVEHIELNIDDLLLDQENPRLGSVSSQSEAIEKLVELNPSHFKTMMQSIKDNGLDPGDSFYVVEAVEDGDYEVLDGNRRLSALIVLNEPARLDGTGLRAPLKKSLAAVSSGFDKKKIEPLRCVLFEKREQANEWIERRHTGAAGGEGRIDWGTIEIQRFKGDATLLDILNFVGRNADFTPEEWQSTRAVIESRKSSTLGRLLESAYGRAHIGIAVLTVNGQLVPHLSSDPAWALGLLKKLIQDIRDGHVDSRDLNKASDIEGYFKSLDSEYQRSAVADRTPTPFRDIILTSAASLPAMPPVTSGTATTGAVTGGTNGTLTIPASPAVISGGTSKTKLAPKPRVTLAPKKSAFLTPGTEKGRRLLREATRLNADEFTISCAFVLRAFVELAVSEYMIAHKLPTTEVKSSKTVDLDASQRADRVAKDIVAKATFNASDLRPFNSQIVNKTSPTSIQSLNGFVHNKFAIPTADALRAGWDASLPVFIAAYGKP